MDNLWPENIGQASDNLAPLTILQEQAKLLGDRTQNIVTADVETVIDNDDSLKPFVHSFYVVAPLLQKFRYRLLEIAHDIELYPLNIYTDKEIFDDDWRETSRDHSRAMNYVEVKDEAELMATLKMIFSSNKAKRIVANLMSQSKQLGGYVATPPSEDFPF